MVTHSEYYPEVLYSKAPGTKDVQNITGDMPIYHIDTPGRPRAGLEGSLDRKGIVLTPAAFFGPIKPQWMEPTSLCEEIP